MVGFARAGTRARTLAGTLALTLGVSVVAPAAGPHNVADAAADDVVALVLEGTGNGHGRGMSQWGAYGYAVDHGWTWTEILDHYYGGTSLGDVNSSQTRIKVRLQGLDGLTTVGLLTTGSGVRWNGKTSRSMYAVETAPGAFDVYGSASKACPPGTTLSVPDGNPVIAKGSTDAASVTQIQEFLRTFWDASLIVDGSFGNQTFAVLSAWQDARNLPEDGKWSTDDAAEAREQISAASGSAKWEKLGTGSGTLRFTTPGGDDTTTAGGSVLGVCNSAGDVTHYRGAIEVSSQPEGNRVVNDVKTEDYLRGVVTKEISASWADAGSGTGIHAVRAQAVAARSYGLQQKRYSYATTCDTQSCQVYGGAATRKSAASSSIRSVEDARTDRAIRDTAGKVRTWPDGSVVSTEFSASNGPRTAGGAFPPVDDIGDDTSSNPNHRWTRIIDADDLAAQQGLGTITAASMAETNDPAFQGFDGIWFDDVVIAGTNGTFRMQAWDFRNAYALPAPGFTIRAITEDTTNKSFGFIGDSVGNSIAHSGGSEFGRVTAGTYASQTIDVVDSRCTTRTSCPGTSGVEAAGDLPADLDLVLVELGYNDDPATFGNAIDAMMDALIARGVGQVAWVNMADIRTSGGESVYAPSNAALAAAESRWGQLTVLDWDAHSDTSERVRWFRDGVHLTTTGQAEFAVWLRSELQRLTPSHYLAPPKRIELPVVGETLTAPDGSALTVPESATGVALNVAVVKPAARGFGTVWPCQSDRPVVASLNFEQRDVLSNSVVAPISSDGTVCLYSSAGTNIVVDVAGWFTGATDDTAPDPFVGLLPDRRADTRTGIGGFNSKVTPSTPISIPIAGTPATLPDGTATTVPDDVAAVALNVAVVKPARNGFATVWPCGTEMPVAANVNYEPGAPVSNGVVAPVGTDGSVCVHTSATADLVVDINGFFDGSSGGENSLTARAFTPATPTRLVDTRNGVGGPNALVQPTTPFVLKVRGAALTDPADPASNLVVPDDATAVALNLAVVKPSANGFGTVWPCSASMPTAANVNYRGGENISNGVVAPIGEDGTICVYVNRPSDIVVDVAGWFRGGNAASFVGAVPERLVDTRFAVGPAPT